MSDENTELQALSRVLDAAKRYIENSELPALHEAYLDMCEAVDAATDCQKHD